MDPHSSFLSGARYGRQVGPGSDGDREEAPYLVDRNGIVVEADPIPRMNVEIVYAQTNPVTVTLGEVAHTTVGPVEVMPTFLLNMLHRLKYYLQTGHFQSLPVEMRGRLETAQVWWMRSNRILGDAPLRPPYQFSAREPGGLLGLETPAHRYLQRVVTRDSIDPLRYLGGGGRRPMGLSGPPLLPDTWGNHRKSTEND